MVHDRNGSGLRKGGAQDRQTGDLCEEGIVEVRSANRNLPKQPFHSKSTCLHTINFRALCGAQLVTLPPQFEGNEALMAYGVCADPQLVNQPNPVDHPWFVNQPIPVDRPPKVNDSGS